MNGDCCFDGLNEEGEMMGRQHIEECRWSVVHNYLTRGLLCLVLVVVVVVVVVTPPGLLPQTRPEINPPKRSPGCAKIIVDTSITLRPSTPQATTPVFRHIIPFLTYPPYTLSD